MDLKKYTLNLIPFLVLYLILIFFVLLFLPHKVIFLTYKVFLYNPWLLVISILILITLSVYRLIRLIAFDIIFKPYRLHLKDVAERDGEHSIAWIINKLILCPWCLSIWLVPITILILMLGKIGVFILLILSISGISTMIHLIVSLIAKNIPKG